MGPGHGLLGLGGSPCFYMGCFHEQTVGVEPRRGRGVWSRLPCLSGWARRRVRSKSEALGDRLMCWQGEFGFAGWPGSR